MRFLLSDLQPGTAYVVRARSKNGAIYSNWSREFALSTNSDLIAPKTPANPVASMSGTSFVLKWDAVTQSSDNSLASDLDRYEVEASSTTSVNTGVYVTKDTKFEFSFEQNVNLFGTPQANVRLRVRAVDSAGNASAYTALASQTNPAPAAPTGFAGVAGVNSLSFSWNAVSDLDLKQYRIYSGTTSGTQGTLVWTGTALNATIQVTDTSTDRWYKVVAVDVFNTESAASNVVGPLKPSSATSVDTTAPAVPTGLSGTLTNSVDGKTASMAVSWTAVADTDLDSYVLAFRQTASPVNDWQYVYVDKSLTSTTIQGLVPYKAYDIRIRAKDYSANYSAWTTIVNVTAQANAAPAIPTGLAITTGKDNIRLSWTENTEDDMKNNAGTYDVQVATNSGFTTGLLTYRTGSTSLSINGLAESTTYYARVRAVDSAGATSSYSTAVNATTGAYAIPSKYTVSATAPSSPNANDVWMDTTSGFEKYWTGSAWANTGNVSTSYIAARGEDLVTNGTALMGNNYNFSVFFNYNGADAPIGASGSFVVKTTANQGTYIDELIAFDPAKSYKFSFQCRQTVSGQTNTMYGFIMPFDAFNNSIQPGHYMYVANTTTTLAAPLNPGDTTITLTSAANWFGQAGKPAGSSGYLRNAIFWDYVDASGKAWATGTYSRNLLSTAFASMWADGGISGNVITLSAPYAGVARPAGTPLSNATSGGVYIYMPTATSVVVPETWTTYTDTFSAGVMNPSLQAVTTTGNAAWTTGVPPGTAKIKVGWLLNYPAGGTGKHAVASVSLSNATAAQATADLAYASANGKNKIVRSTSAASGTTGYVAGDLWWQVDGSNNVIGQWRFVSGAWVAEQIKSDIIANLDVNKLTAGSGFITDLSIGTGGVIKSANYVAGTTGFRLSNTGLIIEGSGNTVKADVLKGGIITGTTISVGAGGVLTVDSTGAIRSNNYAIGATGYRLDASGLEVNDGSIDAKVLKTNSAVIGDLVIGRSADTAGTVRSFDYSAGTAGWKIGKGLFEINQGAIKAGALLIQDSDNIVPPEYAAFEFTPTFYNALATSSNATMSIQTSGGKFGSQYIRFTGTAVGSTFYYLTPGSANNYNIPVESGETYIVSAYMRSNQTSVTNFNLRLRASDGTYIAYVTPAAGTLSATTWNRFSTTVTIAAGITSVQMMGRADWANIGDYIEIDGIQIERKVAGSNTPSPWTMPGVTSIDGAIIRTGEMRSNTNVTVNGVLQPAWSVNLAGGAQFGDAAVRGSMVVGPATSTNLAPNGGTFESNVTGYTVYSVGGTGAALSRTTTAGELITGTGSMKIGWTTIPTKYGFSFSLINPTVSPAGIPANNVIKLTMKVRGLTTSSIAGSDLVAEFLDASNNVLFTTSSVLPVPTYLVPNTVMNVNYNIVLPSGIANATTVRIYSNKSSVTPDATGVVYDDIAFSVGDDVGSSYISSGNYVQGDMGWRIGSGGVAEFNNVTIRGGLQTASSGPRWQIGTTPQWYGQSSEIISYSGSALEDIPAKIMSYGGGMMLQGSKATNVGSYPSFSLTNNNFLSTDPNTYMGTANLQASGIYIQGNGGLASNGSRYAGTVDISAQDDTAGTVRGTSYVRLESAGADSPTASLQMFSSGPIKAFVSPWGGAMPNPKISLSYYDYESYAYPTGRLVIDDTNVVLGGKYDSGTAGNTTLTLGPATATLNIDTIYGYDTSLTMSGITGAVDIVAGPRLSLTSTNGMKDLSGNIVDQLMWQSRAVDMLSGGGAISVDTSFNIKWSQRFIAIALGRGTNTFTGGYLSISMPAVGSVIQGVGTTPNVTVTASGIALNNWHSLWYEPVFGSNGTVSDDSAFRIFNYAQDYTIPPHWIPVAVRNGDLTMVYFGNGVGYTPWYPIPLTGWTVYDAAGTGYRQPEYRRDSMNRVHLRGVIKHATTTTTGVIGTALPAAFRPSETEMFGAISNNGIARVNCSSDGTINVVAYGTGASGAWVSLSGMSWFAD